MKTRLKLVGSICAAVCAFAALPVAAHAAEPEWFVNGVKLAGANHTVTSTGGPFTLSSNIATIRCITESSEKGTIENGATPGGGSGTINFSGCEVVGAPACEVVEPIVANVKTMQTPVATKQYTIFEPASGTVFTTIFVEGCAAEGEFPVTGNVAGFDSEAAVEKENHTLTFSPTISEEAGTELKFGSAKATLSGSSTLMLAEPVGATWSSK